MNMKIITARIIAAGALLCIAMAAATGCSSVKRHNTSSEAPTADQTPMLEMPLEFIDPGEDDENPLSELGIDLDADDPVAEDSTQVVMENATEVVKETDANGQPVTEVQEATEIQVVTDENGEQHTEAVVVTRIVEKTRIVDKTDEKGQIVTQPAKNTVTTAAPGNNYTPKTKSRYAMWLDISKDENFFFEGQFLKYTFKVKEGIPDGDYKIKLTPDFSDVTGTSVYADKVFDGTIRVNNGSIDAANVASETGLIVYGDNVACKQGDTVDFYVNIKNNSGVVAFVMKTYYDGNALELIDNGAAGDFEYISSRNTDFGEAKAE
jgi:hypothetical protein